MEINFVVEGKVIRVEMPAVPSLGERVQIEKTDYVVTSRDWTIDYSSEPGMATARVTIGLERPE